MEPRRKPVQERSRETVEAILVAAAQVFETVGISAGTTSRIAKRAGISIGTLYQYFPGKESIMVALLEEHLHERTRWMREWVGQMVSSRNRLRDALKDYVGGVMEIHGEMPRLQYILLEEATMMPTLQERVIAAEEQAVNTLAGLFRFYPGMTHANGKHAAYFMIHTVDTLIHRFVARTDERRMERAVFIDELVDLLEAYLTFERVVVQSIPEPPPVKRNRNTLPVVLL